MAQTERLLGKVAVITGAGSGLGRAMALRFVAEGASVLAADINEAGARQTVELMGDAGRTRGDFRRVDVTSEDDCASAVTQAVERWGRLNVLVANAGIGTPGFISTLERDDWERVLAVNLTGVFLSAKPAFRAMRDSGEGGVILTTASVAGLQGTPHLGAYGASKAGVIQLTQTLALEGARFHIRANAICPVWADTPMIGEFTAGSRATPEETRARLVSVVPLGRMATPADIASAAVYLASDEASFVTGVALPVDGGHMAGHGA
ncbi:MAG: SDR family NAD(P)-dependent oxidoreductase [Ktedonobacterales bacterium]